MQLHVEEYGLFVALQVDIETIDRVAAARLARRDQRGAAVGRHQSEHGIGRIGGLAVEIDPRIIMQQHAAREYGEHDVRRSEEHTSELQSQSNLVCRLLLGKKKTE